MRLVRLDLTAIGHFTNVQLHFGPGLHIVYGPNEAGKTTSLRAIRQLLFGFDERTRDNFVHQNSNLRIGGLLRSQSGIEFAVVRRKSRKDSLRTADESESIDEESWNELLCGIDETTFLNRNGIDYEQLVKGGHEIATGTGDLGEILFATGSGLSDLTAVQKRLLEEADELFRPRGQRQRLNQAFLDWQQESELLTERILSVSQWEEVDRRRQEMLTEVERIATVFDVRIKEKDQLLRWKQSLPLIQEHDSLVQQLSLCGSIRELPIEFPSLRQTALLLLKQADNQEQAALKSIHQTQDDLSRLVVPIELIQKTDELAELLAKWGSNQKAQSDQNALIEQRNQIESQCIEIQQALRLSTKTGTDFGSKIDRAQRIQIHQLGRKRAVLASHVNRAEICFEQLQKQFDELNPPVATLPSVEATNELIEVVRRIRMDGDLEARFERVMEHIGELKNLSLVELDRLGLWKGTVEGLASIQIPAIEAVGQWEAKFNENWTAQSILKSRHSEIDQETQRYQTKLDAIQSEFNVPSETELQIARNNRDEILVQIRRTIEAKKVPSLKLISAFEASVIEADQVSDRLRSQAAIVGEISDLKNILSENQQRQNSIVIRLEELIAKQLEDERQWQSEWRELGTSALAPREMQAWIARREILLQREAQLTRRTCEADELKKGIDERRTQIAHSLHRSSAASDASMESGSPQINRIGTEARATVQQLSFGWDLDIENVAQAGDSRIPLTEGFEDRSLRELLVLAESTITQNDAVLKAWLHFEETRDRLTREKSEANNQLQLAKQEFSEWQTSWEAALVELNIDLKLSPDAVDEFLESLSVLSDHRRQSEQLQKRIAEIASDSEQFNAMVKAVCVEVAPDLVCHSANEATKVLRDRLFAGQKAFAMFNELTARKQILEIQLVDAGDLRKRGLAQIVELCSITETSLPEMNESGLDSQSLNQVFEELAKVEAASQRRSQLKNQRDHIHSRLLELAGDTPFSEYLQQVQSLSPDQLDSSLVDLEQEIRELGNHRDQLNRQIGGIDEQLQRMNGSAEAADVEARHRQLNAQIRADIEQYARFKIASSVLHTAIERYREKIRGPVLTVASDYFRELTLKSFDGLRVDEDDSNSPVLVGVRNEGREVVSVEGMSEGTCDQLYLALRLASLTLETSPRCYLPFILDDILIQFDDARSAAALRLLSKIGQQRQVIFFTHHEHLIEIANQHLTGEYSVHRMVEP